MNNKVVVKDDRRCTPKTCYVWGAGGAGLRIYNTIKDDFEVLGFIDSDEHKWGKYALEGLMIYKPDLLKELDYDCIILGTMMGIDEVPLILDTMAIPREKLITEYASLSVNARRIFLKRMAELIEREKVEGAVGEVGVYRGEFAKEINTIFPNRNLYLFDTFEGFDNRDFGYEEDKSLLEAEHFKTTSIDLVMDKMKYKEKVIIKCGYFPETTVGVEDKFVFVNLDCDLYKPTIEGLKFFWPRMQKGGCILIHDYFGEGYPNVKKAVKDFEETLNCKLACMPIGDDLSIAILKNTDLI